jgi:hypothetical protein
MNLHRTTLITVAFLVACAKVPETPTPLTTAFTSSFRELPLPDAAAIRRQGVRRRFPVNEDQARRSLVLLGFQHGILLAPEKREGLFVFMAKRPFLVLLESIARDTSDVYLYSLVDLDTRQIAGQKPSVTPDSVRTRWAGDLLDQLALQIHSNDRWPYLRRSEPHRF